MPPSLKEARLNGESLLEERPSRDRPEERVKADSKRKEVGRRVFGRETSGTRRYRDDIHSHGRNRATSWLYAESTYQRKHTDKATKTAHSIASGVNKNRFAKPLREELSYLA